ncbi:MAG: glycosyltransferase [Candidatus Omnitrophota bacterium]
MIKEKRKILMMYITKVSGHRQATLAIQQSLRSLDPDVDVPAINGFGYTYPRLEKVVNRAYLGIIRRTPKVWDYLYDNPRIVKGTGTIKNFLHRTSHKKLRDLFERYRPDTVVCTQAFPCGMVADYKRANHLKVTLIGVLTDFAPHSFWLNEGVDYYIVPSIESKDRFVAKGIPPDSIKVYGIPIRTRFAMQLDKGPIAEKLGLDLKIPILLIMGGGQGLGPIKEIVHSLNRLDMPLQFIVIAGTNKELNKWLQGVEPKKDKKMLIYDYSRDIDKLMEISTLIITKPGGLTTAECLAKGLPMVIVNSIPGQEMRNTDFLLKKSIAIRVDNTSDVGEEIELLLKSPDRLAAMRKAAYENAKPYAALNIAKLILDRPLRETAD